MKTATKPADLGAIAQTGVEIMIPTRQIYPSPYQTRKRFDEDAMNTLAESLRTHGQLQNLIVRKVGDRYELIGGERRWRAGTIVMPVMRCLVIEADDDQARELVIIENVERENVSAIEEAAGFQQLIESGQYTQKTLAERLHRDPSFISNRIRLLSLPEEWRSQILNGELLPTQARLLVPWADRPAVLESIRKRLDNIITPDNDAEEDPLRIVDISCDDFEDIISAAAQPLSRSMQVGYWDGPKFEITDEIRAELDVADVPQFNGKQPRAFNVELWDRLQNEALAVVGQRRSQANTNDLDQDEDDLDTDDSGDAESVGAVSRLQEWSLVRNMSRHVSSVLAGHIKADTTGVRTFLMAMADDGGYAFLNWVGESQQLDENDLLEDAGAWKALAVVNQKNALTQMALFLQERLADGTKGQLLSLEQLLLVCRDMQLDPVAKWVPDAELLDLCSDDQLREILVDNVGPEKQVRKWKRARMLKEAADNWMPGFLPILLKPKVMVEFEAAEASR